MKRRAERFAGGLPGCFAVALCWAMIAVIAMPSHAEAQERRQKKSIIEFLFGKKKQAPTRRQQAPTRRSTSRQSAAPAAPAPPKVEKLENARKVLVFGDFIAGGLADGLKEAFAESPGVVIVEQTSGSSGLVRDDYYDWPEEIGPILDEVKPTLAVLAIGSNDRQQLVVDGNREDVRSQKWIEEYTRRATELAKKVTGRGIPLLWVGAPAFSSRSMSADMLAFNGIYLAATSQVGGEFVDIWDGFVDENGKFIYTGSDIKGQQVRLRTSDGINMTRAGKRKLAFYVEKPARRILGDAASTTIATLGTENLPELTFLAPNEPANVVRTQPISVVDPDLDGGQGLLDSKALPPPNPESPRELLVRKGELAPPPEGRADDFRLRRSSRASEPVDAEPTGSLN